MMINEYIMSSFSKNLSDLSVQYELNNYNEEIKEYWKKKRKDEKVKKPKPKFSENFINRLKNEAIRVEYCIKNSNEDVQKASRKYFNLVKGFENAWKLYKQRV